MDVIRWFWNGLRLDEFTFCSTLWWVWCDRNNSIFNPDDARSPIKVRSLCLSLIKDLNVYNKIQPASIPSSLLVDWIPPVDPMVKINCNASLFHDSLVAGFGCVIWDSNSSWIRGCLGT
ncbi:hypothetical protein PIB30_059167, partial [Stylosanthes scabra]|nr:hypothetical protein [Stylosanthes scabra]